MIKYSISKSYTETPGPRYESEGEFSGENFRKTVLINLVKEAKEKSEKIELNLDGGYGYPTSFLEEAFGGLIRQLQDKSLTTMFVFISEEEPALIDEIKSYMIAASEVLK